MSLVALTSILHGKKDGATVLIAQGEDIPANVFTKDELSALREQGAVGEPVKTATAITAEQVALEEELRKQIADLEAKLAAKEPK